jgi:hypothetical protein
MLVLTAVRIAELSITGIRKPDSEIHITRKMEKYNARPLSFRNLIST